MSLVITAGRKCAKENRTVPTPRPAFCERKSCRLILGDITAPETSSHDMNASDCRLKSSAIFIFANVGYVVVDAGVDANVLSTFRKTNRRCPGHTKTGWPVPHLCLCLFFFINNTSTAYESSKYLHLPSATGSGFHFFASSSWSPITS
jgi:hypothetical protein